jgi:hypothetical protein
MTATSLTSARLERECVASAATTVAKAPTWETSAATSKEHLEDLVRIDATSTMETAHASALVNIINVCSLVVLIALPGI